MPLSWNEIRRNAIRFSREWAGETREEAEAKSFWDEFFGVFGIRRRTVASFKEPVKNLSGDYGYIDLFWKGILLVEHKSFGRNLGKAESQAFRYIQDLAREGRHDEIPRYIIVSDFARIALHDLEPEEQRDLPLFAGRRVATTEFPLAELHQHVHALAFIPGYKQHKFEDQDPINLKAVGIMGTLHDALEAGGYTGHDLERFLVRILFCLFAEDTGIFERESFRLYLQNRTAADGSDLGLHLARLFEVLNTAKDKRQRNLDETLATFPYVNGELFQEHLGFADFNRDMRNALLACTHFDWSRISPAIFGSLFQAVMEPRERRRNRRPLHQRTRHPEGHPVFVPRQPPRRIRTRVAEQGGVAPIPPEACLIALSRSRMRLRQFSRNHLPRTSPTRIGNAQAAVRQTS